MVATGSWRQYNVTESDRELLVACESANVGRYDHEAGERECGLACLVERLAYLLDVAEVCGDSSASARNCGGGPPILQGNVPDTLRG
jgi:hypothetical protein